MAADRPNPSSPPDAPTLAPDVSPAGQRLIGALLSLEPAVARSVRSRAVRRRPRRQVGPSAEYGEPAE